MQMKDVIISVRGLQSTDGNDPMELVTPGSYGIDADGAQLDWAESELTGLEGTNTTVTVNQSGVTVERKGQLNSRMEFQAGKKNYFLYETPFGSATIGLNTNRVQTSLGIHGGEILVDYSLDMEHKNMGRNRIYIKVEEPKISHSGDIKWPI